MRPKQAAIIQALGVKSAIDPEAEIESCVSFLTNYVERYSFVKSLVLGISGGQDSTLVGKLAERAVQRLRVQGRDCRFIAVRLPYGVQADATDVEAAIDFIEPDVDLTVNIQPAVDQTVQSLEAAGVTISDYNKGNLKARQRMLVQYAVAGAHSGVVLGTDHAAEALTGFYTKFGDGAADVMPIKTLDKGQGRQLLKALDCPPALYEKVPMADLEEEKPQQPDTEALGLDYADIDAYLEGREVPDAVATKIEHYYDTTEHKRHLPISPLDHWWR